MFLDLDLHYPDPVQHLKTTGQDLSVDDLSVDYLSDVCNKCIPSQTGPASSGPGPIMAIVYLEH